MVVPQKAVSRITYDPAILLLNTYPKVLKAASQSNIFTPMFTAAVFPITKMWKQPKCLLTDEQGIHKIEN